MSLLRPGMPVGSIIPYAGPVLDRPKSPGGFPKPGLPAYEYRLARSGWLTCDGRAVAVAKYRELFLVIGFVYGRKGNGYFCLPDYRGRVLRGVNLSAVEPSGGLRDPDQDTRGPSGPQGWEGDCVGSVQEDALRKHWHYYDRSKASGLSKKGKDVYGSFESVLTEPSVDKEGTAGDNDEYAARETRGKNVYVHYLIKYTRQGCLPWPTR